MKVINEKNVYNGYFGISKVIVLNKEEQKFTFERIISRSGAVAIVFDTLKKKYIFVKQFRPGPLADVIEGVAGLIDEGYTSSEAISREIREEIGYEVDYLLELGEPVSMSPNFTEKIHIYYAEVSNQVEEGGGLVNDGEEIEPIHVTIDEIPSLKITDAKTLIGLYKCNLI